MMAEFDKAFDNEEEDFYYVISKKWLDEWKMYVSYEEFTKGESPASTIGSPINSTINDDLIDETI